MILRFIWAAIVTIICAAAAYTGHKMRRMGELIRALDDEGANSKRQDVDKGRFS
ncbi:hypothetical protein ACPOL_0883 [Acidisarcina polymorpha]|uniref:Uncharacterized protein n=1 Tax=Acidisarcina polymorpha TaxID=2211140 RepID=A0A2Z5FTW0_9BACT|nr:hypothetical protein ACPOL_0883 [Acidisarcina polymorpha]